MILQRFDVPGLAHYSYVIGSEGQAVVIDPQRNTSVYRDFARLKGLSIAHILETHLHADYASGAPALAEHTGAKLWLSAYDVDEQFSYKMPHISLADSWEIYFGALRLVARHTPGHTPEHLSFLLYEQQGCGHPLGFFSGDFLLIGSLGPPDLLGGKPSRPLRCNCTRGAVVLSNVEGRAGGAVVDLMPRLLVDLISNPSISDDVVRRIV